MLTNYQILTEKLRLSEWENVSLSHDDRVEIRGLAYLINMEKAKFEAKSNLLLEQIIELRKELSALKRGKSSD